MDTSKLLAIDPPGCGCTECSIGEYIPLNDPRIDEVFADVVNGVIELRNNHYCTLVVYRDVRDNYGYVEVPLLQPMSDYLIVPPYTDSYLSDEEAKKVLRITDEITGSLIYPEYSNYETLGKQVADAVNLEIPVINETRETVILYVTRYQESGISSIADAEEENIKILWYE